MGQTSEGRLHGSSDVLQTFLVAPPRWRCRKWRQPRPGAAFSTPIVVVVENGSPSASGCHLGWPHSRFPVLAMRSSKMVAGSGRAAIFHHHHNGVEKAALYYWGPFGIWNRNQIGKAIKRCQWNVTNFPGPQWLPLSKIYDWYVIKYFNLKTDKCLVHLKIWPWDVSQVISVSISLIWMD